MFRTEFLTSLKLKTGKSNIYIKFKTYNVSKSRGYIRPMYLIFWNQCENNWTVKELNEMSPLLAEKAEMCVCACSKFIFRIFSKFKQYILHCISHRRLTSNYKIERQCVFHTWIVYYYLTLWVTHEIHIRISHIVLHEHTNCTYYRRQESILIRNMM